MNNNILFIHEHSRVLIRLPRHCIVTNKIQGLSRFPKHVRTPIKYSIKMLRTIGGPCYPCIVVCEPCTYLHYIASAWVDDANFLVLARDDEATSIPVPRGTQWNVGQTVNLYQCLAVTNVPDEQLVVRAYNI